MLAAQSRRQILALFVFVPSFFLNTMSRKRIAWVGGGMMLRRINACHCLENLLLEVKVEANWKKCLCKDSDSMLLRP